MANTSVDNLSYKDSPVAASTNHKADFAKQIFQEYKIALQTMKRHGLIDEFVCAVKGGANHPVEEPTAPEVVVDYHDYRDTNR
jgi:hypothetical protein